MIDLQVSRKQIDEIDSQIVKLFEERMKVANEVAKYKMETGKAVFDKEREEPVSYTHLTLPTNSRV